MSPRHEVVSHSEWIEARRELLRKEKEFTRLRARMSEQQRALPWEAVDKSYAFDGPDGRETLSDLFAGRSQLIVYHFMFGPEGSAGCQFCSFWADNFDGAIVHLAQRDVTMVAVSRAPYAKLAAYRQRMGWRFKWVSSGDTDFNFDFQASFAPDAVESNDTLYNFTAQAPGKSEREGISVFCRDEDGRIFHTYSTYARGIDAVNGTYQLLDLVPRGRDEGGRSQFWVRRHDEYAGSAAVDKQFEAIGKARR
jgi:predicted dithiol-disulfide oxidoreductase (DUF899 family)